MKGIFPAEVRPAHYTALHPEPIEVIEAWGLGFCLGNAVKYLSRAGKKPGTDAVTDLEKSVWYIQREIARMQKDATP